MTADVNWLGVINLFLGIAIGWLLAQREDNPNE